MTEAVYSVSEINNFIKHILEQEPELRNLQVVGEISNFKRYPSGHCYFTLKDAGAVLKCVMFRSKAVSLRFQPQNGDTVVAVGRLAVYERDGVYQLYTDLLLQQGVGDLMQAYEKLKQKLERAGLFAPERKQQLPLHPRTVGIITSPAGAAVRDIITVSRRRNQGIKLLLYPVKVQGEGAAAEIAAAIEFFNRKKLADVLIVGRGGGSVEDLWSFNEEVTVRAVATSKIPVVSAVGHETDYTICDFVSDLRAPTPSAAAELAVPDSNVLIDFLDNANKRLSALLNDRIEREYQKLDNLMLSSFMAEPGEYFSQKFDEVDVLYARLKDGFSYLVEKENSKFSNLVSSLDALSPLKVLARGYSITTKNEKVIRDIEDINIDDELKVKLSKGYTKCVVKEVVSDE